MLHAASSKDKWKNIEGKPDLHNTECCDADDADFVSTDKEQELRNYFLFQPKRYVVIAA